MTELDVALRAAHAAAAAIPASGPLDVRHKGTFDLVTQADVAAERAIREVLERHTPDIPILGEEGGGGEAATTRWVVDPIDGTTNFVHGVPHYGISIALEVDGEPVAGVIHNPGRGQTYRAAKGQGAWLDDQRLSVSSTRELSAALCATGFSVKHRDRLATSVAIAEAVLRDSHGIRRFGAASLDLAYVAAGTFDAYFELYLSRWDVAAGILLVREAGGRVEALPGYGLGDAPAPLATNGWLHDALFSLIEATLRERDAGEEG
ncbi:MAG: inositol monophosphatase family protein [Myxococcota bacterium]